MEGRKRDEGKNHLEDLGMNGRKMLKWILNNQDEMGCTKFICLGLRRGRVLRMRK
jgi:hypothetical protein